MGKTARRLPRRMFGVDPTRIQTLLLQVSTFKTESKARMWAREHGFKAGIVSQGKRFFRIRQLSHRQCKGQVFRTIQFTSGVKAIICR